jgi:glycosyltransferase involved in cell wall biosynthesis
MVNQPFSESADSPKVSVIMNCLNCSKYLREAIDSVYSQTYKDWEIIFWDNVSTDNSAEIAKSYGNKLRYFRGEKTVPLGHARNLAIEKAKGEFIAFLDCDDIWLPEKLKKGLEVFEKKAEVMLVYSNSFVVDAEGNTIKTFFDSEKPARGNVFNKLFCSYNFIPLLTAIVKKEVFGEVGLFDNNYKIAEEYDLFLKIASKYPVDYVEQSLAKYRVHESNFSNNQKIGIKEELEIIDKWLHKDPTLKKELGMKIKVKKMRRYAALYLFYLVKYAHLPKSLSKFY